MTELSEAAPLDYREIFAAERSELLRFLQGLDGALVHLPGDDT